MYLTITYSRHTTSHFFDIKQRRRERERVQAEDDGEL